MKSEGRPQLRLYSYFRSSSAWRVRIVLNLKNLDHEIIPVHLARDGGEQLRPEFREKNPLEQIPVLEVSEGGSSFRLTQSVAIAEYLEERFPEPPLLPAAPEARARVRELVEIVNAGIQPLQNLRHQNELRARDVDPRPLVRDYVHRGLRALESRATQCAGRFLFGDAVTLADAYLVPQLAASRRFDIDLEPFHLLRRVEEACVELPAFARAHANAQVDRDT